ncbi:helix-turn-helix domain-containing protein [Demequina sp. B12]|uniref:helix-turn-helix domain-containing protein n=1 Tax=Demequina sp. B12 TaxID=2992757 RepID=UPI00237B81ED|nr:helix-turn-helix domain-containing protein [Demequina sp. B12]MDE0571890.1 helix-turn-helix domain-containing protein [Demequina sp. B12]
MTDMTVKEVAEVLRCSVHTVYSVIRQRRLDHYRVRGPNGRIRITPEALDAFRGKALNRDPWARTRPLKATRNTQWRA